MPVFALYNFNDNSTVVDDAPINGIQNGIYFNEAFSTGGDLLLDGVNDFVKIYPANQFQMPQGTLEINFTPTGTLTAPQTVLSRDSAGENQGSYQVEVYPDGSILVTHETEGGTTTFSTGPGFYAPGDTINLSYSWDQGGTGGLLNIDNQTTGDNFQADVPTELTMDMADLNQPWIIGASQDTSDPDILTNIDENFAGSVEFFSLSDTVDNLQDPDANPDTATTVEDVPVVIDVLNNDTDPNGDPLEIVGVPTAGNGSVAVNADGTITYTPATNFNGPDTITYTVTDPDGNTSTSTVSVTVNPVNDAPEANPDASVTDFNMPVTFAVLGNDTDVDGDTLIVSGTPTSAQGTVAVNADGSLTFTPTPGFTGVATVDYTIVDEEGLTDITTWTITVGDNPSRDGIVSGTSDGDLIDGSYMDPTDGDRVDANDALLPGEVGNDDIIRAGDGNDTVLAGEGNDEVEAGTGDDSVNGNDGDDYVLGQAGNDSVYGDAGNDTVNGGTGDDEVVGGAGDDVIEGAEGDDALQGNAGNDIVIGGTGNDSLLGGDGNDTITSGGEGSPDRTYPGLYTADLNPNDDRDSVIAGVGDDVVSTGDDADTILAGVGNDTIDAGNDDDLVNGGDNDDVITAGEGNDTVSADAGDDVVYGGSATNNGPTDLIDAVDLDDNNNRDSLLGGLGDDSIYGGDDADTIGGGEGADLLDGGIDDDSILGDAGADQVLGGEGDDTIDGGTGDDTIRGDGPGVADAHDRAYPGLYPADAIPDNNRDFITAGDGNDQVYGGDDADTIFGDAGADTIYAGIDADSVVGGAGADLLAGEEGSDTMDGGVGDDLIVGGNYNAGAADPLAQPNPLNLADASDLDPGNDRDSLSGGDGNDTIYGLDDDDTLDGGDGNDLLNGGIDEDSLLGGAGDDQLIGGDGNDTADGGAGNDLITDGLGNDVAVGGADRDTFVGANAGDAVDGSESGDDFDTLDLRGVGPISIVYDPANAENGTVTYLDGAGNPTGTMNFVNIENVISDVPDANPDLASTPEDTPVTIDVLGNDTDPNGDTLEIVGVPTAEHGTVTVNPDGTLTYTPDENYNGPDTITYTATDPAGNQATSTVAVTVTPENDAPDAVDDVRSTPYETAIIIPVLGNDSDVDGDTLTVTAVGTSPDGTVTLNLDGTVSFLPNDGFYGDATFTYTVTDPAGLTDTATVTVTVVEPPRDGIVRGTDDAELIDTAYIDPFDGDRIDRNDAIIPGDGPNDDRVIAGDGNDTILAGVGNDTVIAGLGDDSAEGGDGNDDLRGNEGNDTLNGGNGQDTIYGQQDDDVIDSSGGTAPLPDAGYPGVYPSDTDPTNDLDLVYGGLGNDTIRTGDDADTVYGDDGRDLIDGGIDDDSLFGGQGGDTIIGSEGDDSIDGGEGSDLIYGGLDDAIGEALDLPDAVDLRPDNNRDSITGGTGDDTIFGRDDDDTIDGGVGNDLIDGGIDEDSILGGTGNDTITGSQGADTAAGGDDRDVFTLGSQEAGIGDVIDGNEGGDDFDTMDLRGSGPLSIVYDPANAENGVVTFLDADGNPTGTLNFTNIENVIPCFTPGTLIATPRGEVPVELLKAGDKVVTRDNGIQEIRWVGEKAMSGHDLRLNNHLQPVFIKRGALGNGLPEQDMMVSPNHRLLVANDRTQLYFDEHEVLVAAKHLVGTQGVYALEAICVTYLHFMFDRHEVVLSNGAWTESFQPGDYTLKGMGNAQRNEIFDLFPELKSDEGLEGYTSARRTLKRHEARLLVK